MGFLDNYEASRERLERWIKTYPTGRIETRIVEFSAEKGYVLVEAKAFRNHDDVFPAGIDYAYGYQAAYQPNMRRWFVEDSVTSAIMRVQQLVMGGAERTTKEVMEQVERAAAVKQQPKAQPDYWTTKFEDHKPIATPLASSLGEIAKQLGGELVAEAPMCAHGHMVWKQSHDGAPKSWGGYFCTQRSKATQCPPRWHVLASDGKWKPQL
jgi:hypothetical protein